MPPSNSLLLAVAVQAARRASHYAASHTARRHDANAIARNDVKLKLDEECQTIAIRTILDAFPDHAVLAEEDTEELSALKARASEYEWIVDPIDGTVNFFHGNPYWCTSVAVRRDGETLAGCVAAPDEGLLFEATPDGPALCNGAPIHVADTTDITKAEVLTGADKAEDPSKRPFRFFHAIAGIVQRPRICGAAALDLCNVARGAFDGYFEPGIFTWDIAAGDLILRQAGGTGTVMRRFGGHKLAYLGTCNEAIRCSLEGVLSPLF